MSMASAEQLIDYDKSFFWFTINTDQMTRILIDARTLVKDEKTGATEELFLITACQGERMWVKGRLIQDPPYEFVGVMSEKDMVINRVWASHQPGRVMEFDYKAMYPYFNKITFNLKVHGKVKKLVTLKEQTDAIKADKVMVCRTKVKSADGRYSAVMEYPLKTVNLLISNDSVQVDTGPILAPVWADANWGQPLSGRMIEHFRQAYIVYNTQAEADMTLRVPTDVGNGVRALHYSHYLKTAAENELFAICEGV
jgi:hypothetical protein